MSKLCNYDQCTGCGACIDICPKACIKMEPDSEGFWYPVVQTEHCINCNRCQKICPILAERSPVNVGTTAYGAINLDERIRFDSTSGGVFTLLCEWILGQGGVVFGAAYDDNFNVSHCRIDAYEELHKLRGAKYVQSALRDTFGQVKECLQEGKYVLFSGTPCQIAGLSSFIGKNDEHLFLVDLICHGVPSPKVWGHYIDYRSKTDASGVRPTAINLRSKETGWPGYSIRFDYTDGISYTALNSQDSYLRGFVGNLYLRPSCYHCHFKGSVRQSDFTLGDYWGVWSQLPAYNDGKGTSLVLIHTKKAKELWQYLSPQMQYAVVEVDSALIDNPSALESSALTDKRRQFFTRFENEDFQTLIEELHPKQTSPGKRSFIHRVMNKIRRMLS